MLHEFLTIHRTELLDRCKAKVARRLEPATAFGVEHGVPLFLKQMTDTLRREQRTSRRDEQESAPTPAPTPIGRSAALNGAELLARGYSVDQVVHDYGDVCQAITALAVEHRYSISSDEFRTLNRCVDNAIADAVSAFADGQQLSRDLKSATLQGDLLCFAEEHRRLVAVIVKAYGAIKSGSVGLTGATGNLLSHAVEELDSLVARSPPELLALFSRNPAPNP
jgi:hypothetical protein